MNELARRALQATKRWCLQYDGSTRPAALIRIGTVPILWTKVGPELRLLDFTAAPVPFWFAVPFFVGSILMLLGYKSRLGCISMGLSVTYFNNVEALYNQTGTHFLLTQYWWLPVCLAMTDSGKSFSVDRWLAVRKAEKEGQPPPAEWGSNMGLRFLAIHLAHIYFWGAFDKTDWDWFNGERLDRLWMEEMGTSEYPEGPLWAFAFRAAAAGTVMLEYALAFSLFFRRGRLIVMPLGIMMHAIFYATLWVHSFSAMMVLCYLAFIPVETTHQFIERVLGRSGDERATEGGEA